MKLKCIDGVVREFQISYRNSLTFELEEAFCCECGEYFGVHDTHILKPKFKNHACMEVMSNEPIK